MQEFVDKSVCDDRYEMVKDTNTKVTEIAKDTGIIKASLEAHLKTHDRNWRHGTTIAALVIALAAVVVSVVIALTK